VLSYYKKAVDEGAKVVTGGGVPTCRATSRRRLGSADDLDRPCSDDASCIREEIFGPCCHIRPFDTEEEAIRLANDTSYGLAAAIWTQNLSRAHRVAARDGGRHLLGEFVVPARSAHRRSAAPRRPASAAKAGCIRSSSIRNCRNVCIKL
jgi:acyl-CoA reductase-like NAD-dependent aldehyde dehydrogenase